MPLPQSLNQPIAAALKELGDSTPVCAASTLNGGMVNHALRLETRQGRYMLKWNADPLPGVFETEARGLKLLASVGAIRVPEVYAYAEINGNGHDHAAYILMEWLEPSPEGITRETYARLGEQLAALHRQGISPQDPPAYGLDHDNYLGIGVQHNRWETDWVQFFIEMRLLPQMEWAARNGRLPLERRRRCERVIARLPDLLSGVERRPCLTHGDLWIGNVIQSTGGVALIDPAVYYADRETELAYTQMFGGGFDPAFYEAYNAVWPLEPGYPERRDLYNLYHMINHLNHFGDQYAPYVDDVLRRYA